MYLLSNLILIALLLAAAWHDLRYYRIPNILIFLGAATGLLLNALLPQDIGGLGVLASLSGLGIGLVALLPLYLLRAMGAGDIKLMAMIGAFVGPASMLPITVYTLLAGGVLAIGIVLLHGKLLNLADNLKNILFMHHAGSSTASLPATDALQQSTGKLPYGVAIAAGTFAYLATIQ